MSKFVSKLWGSSSAKDERQKSSLTNSRGQHRPPKDLDARRQKFMQTLTQSPARPVRGGLKGGADLDPLGLAEAPKFPCLLDLQGKGESVDRNDTKREEVISNMNMNHGSGAERNLSKYETPVPAPKPKPILKKNAAAAAAESVLSPTKEFIKGAFLGEGHMNEADMEGESEQMQKAMRDVEAFARYLGMDPNLDREYFWIAVEAMIAPLPANWQEYFEGDQAYYFNENTRHTQWEHPLDEYHRQLFRKHKKEAEDLEKMLAKHGGSVMDEERLTSTVAADAAKKMKQVGSGKGRGKSRIVQPQKTDLMGIEKVWGIGPTGLGGIKKNPLGDRTNRVV